MRVPDRRRIISSCSDENDVVGRSRGGVGGCVGGIPVCVYIWLRIIFLSQSLTAFGIVVPISTFKRSTSPMKHSAEDITAAETTETGEICNAYRFAPGGIFCAPTSAFSAVAVAAPVAAALRLDWSAACLEGRG